ncbi:TetR/AcrR family transcriptional regulator [Camelliibacillus cellulosilyticus]|uniref:TetR/AcrR family transcriptional regulator n=1 Tax=Camelliibacillus cellulosilyticus TaxID=2174486 RepID=A0ABV9GJU1_9BACL
MTMKERPKYKKIIDAAVDVIAEHGFHQAQVSKIAKRAGVADGTIYLYFKNKEDILVSLFRDKMAIFIDKITKEMAEQSTVADKLFTMVAMHFQQLADDYSLAIVTQLELRQSNKDLRLEINAALKNYITVIDDLISFGKKEKLFRSDLDDRLARQMIFGTLDETVTNWVMNDHKYDLPSLAKPVTDMLIHGLHG